MVNCLSILSLVVGTFFGGYVCFDIDVIFDCINSDAIYGIFCNRRLYYLQICVKYIALKYATKVNNKN